MAVIRWITGGLIGAAVGVLIWVCCGYFLHREIGWVAWGVGFLVGFGVRYAAYLFDEGDASLAKGLFAALTAIGAIITAKFLLFTILVGGDDFAGLRKRAASMRYDDEALIATIASDICTGTETQGKSIPWAGPLGMPLDAAPRKNDYPPDIWRQAEARWKQLGPKEQQDRKVSWAICGTIATSLGKKPEFGETFSFYDILWFGLAIITAYKVGVGAYGDD